MEILYTEEVIDNLFVDLAAFFSLLFAVIGFTFGVSDLLMKRVKIGLGWFLMSGISIAVFSTVALSDPYIKQHEVILQDGYVIDTTKYKILEQRGEIYVIKEINHKEVK